ncbi:MAG: hypothetical protein ABIY55_19515 [Kofleriaceae bacterium]
MSMPPPPRSNITPSGGTNITPYVNQYKGVAPIPAEKPMTHAPTLGQYWRSDNRSRPGQRKPRWAGRIAFWLGLAAAVTLIGGQLLNIHIAAWVALAFSVVAVFFGLVGFIAGIGRVSSVIGIIFALIGNVFVLSWLGENVF